MQLGILSPFLRQMNCSGISREQSTVQVILHTVSNTPCLPRIGSSFCDSDPHIRQTTSLCSVPPKVWETIVVPFLSIVQQDALYSSSCSWSRRWRMNSCASCCWYPLHQNNKSTYYTYAERLRLPKLWNHL